MTKKAFLEGTGKLNAPRTKAEGREHGTKYNIGKRKFIRENLDKVREWGSLGFSVADIAKALETSHSNINQLIYEDKEVKQAYEQGKLDLYERLTTGLRSKVDAGNLIAILFSLKSRYGWIEEQFRKDKEEKNIPSVQIFLPENGRDFKDQDND